jgi:hypothetical protein
VIIYLPPAPPQYNSGVFNQLIDALRRGFAPVVTQSEAAPRLLLQAPNGTIYEVTVDNSGTLQTAINDGKTRDI